MEPDKLPLRAVARASKVPMAPRKVRRVVDLIRGLPVHDALSLLRFAPQAASQPVYKVVQSAVANAHNNVGADPDLLVISKASVDEGGRPRLGPRYGFRPRAQGRAYRIRNRTSHITVEVESVPGRRSATRSRSAKATQTRSAR